MHRAKAKCNLMKGNYMDLTLPEIPDSLLFEEVPCYITVQDKDCRILRTNRKFRETFGRREGDYCYEVFKQRDTKCPICPMEQTFLDGKPHISEEIVFSPEGYPINVIAQTSPLFNKQGDIIAVIEMATDITENKRLQRRLEESTSKYRMLYNEVPCFISVQNKDFKIIDCNKRFKEEFGDYRNGYCYEIYKKRTTRCDICPVAEAFNDGLVHTSEEIVAGKNNTPINVIVLAAPIKDEYGEIKSVMEMSTDITEIKKIQSQMANIGQMASGLAHTIKGIISGLDGGMYVVESGFKRNEDELIKKGWDMVQRNIGRISSLVLDMLFFAKQRIPELEDISLTAICKDIFILYENKCLGKNIKITLESDFDYHIKGDYKSIYTLVLNLVENAMHACMWDNSKEEHFIKIKIQKNLTRISLVIEDNGTGMDSDTKHKLFTPLFSTKGSSGSGFGLMVVKKIVEEHNSQINVESEAGKGSTFTINFV